MIKEVIFDIDDTLYDYELGHEAGMQAVGAYVQEQFGIEPTVFREIYLRKYEEIKQSLGFDNAAVHSKRIRFQILLEEWGKPLFPHVKQMYQVYWAAFLPGSRPEPGAIECVRRIKEMGRSIGIGTDMTAQMQYEKLEYYGFAPYISHIVTSQEAGAEKPSRKFMDLCLKKAKVKPEECLFVGDNFKKDIVGAARVGMKAVWYNAKGKAVPGGTGLTGADYQEIQHYEELIPYLKSLG